jgi:hypothetical protein
MKDISGNDILLDITINRTPSTGHIHANRDDDKEISIYGVVTLMWIWKAPFFGALGQP